MVPPPSRERFKGRKPPLHPGWDPGALGVFAGREDVPSPPGRHAPGPLLCPDVPELVNGVFQNTQSQSQTVLCHPSPRCSFPCPQSWDGLRRPSETGPGEASAHCWLSCRLCAWPWGRTAVVSRALLSTGRASPGFGHSGDTVGTEADGPPSAKCRTSHSGWDGLSGFPSWRGCGVLSPLRGAD